MLAPVAKRVDAELEVRVQLERRPELGCGVGTLGQRGVLGKGQAGRQPRYRPLVLRVRLLDIDAGKIAGARHVRHERVHKAQLGDEGRSRD